MSKQMIIDYSEYLELVKAKEQVGKIIKACQDGALVRNEYYDECQCKMVAEIKLIVTSDLKSAIEEIVDIK